MQLKYHLLSIHQAEHYNTLPRSKILSSLISVVPTQYFPIVVISVENKTVVTWGIGREFTSNCLLLNKPSLNSTNQVLIHAISLFIHFEQKELYVEWAHLESFPGWKINVECLFSHTNFIISLSCSTTGTFVGRKLNLGHSYNESSLPMHSCLWIFYST